MQDQHNEDVGVASAAGTNNHRALTVTNNGAISTNITGVLLIDPNKVLATFGVGLSSNTTPALPIGLSQGGSATVDTSLLIVAGKATKKGPPPKGNRVSTAHPPPPGGPPGEAPPAGGSGDPLYPRPSAPCS